MDKLTEDLVKIDDRISDSDPEKLDKLDQLLEKRSEILAEIAGEEGPEPEAPPKFEGPDEPGKPGKGTDTASVDQAIAVSRDGEYVVIISNVERRMEGAGDIRDGIIRVQAGVTRRKLQKNNREGFITLNGEKYDYE